MVIGLGYEFSPNIMGIQEGYNKNFHIKCIEYYEKFDSLHIVLRYKDGDMRVMLVSSCELEEILNRPVDIVQEKMLRPRVRESINQDKKLIYERAH